MEKAHHLVREEDLISQCPYCDTNLISKPWSVDAMQHYVQTNCDCGMEICIKFDADNKHHLGLLEQQVLSEDVKEAIFN